MIIIILNSVIVPFLSLSFKMMDVKEEYRSDEDNLINDFFYPCFSTCVEYNRCIEFLSVGMLKTIFTIYDNFGSGAAKLKIVAGHKFRPTDLDLLSIILSKSRNPFEKRNVKNITIQLLRDAFERGQIELKIAIANEELLEESFSDKLGIFHDRDGQAVVYVSTSRESFATRKKGFESVDVYTSWRDETRVKKKIENFERLWANKMEHIDVYDFEHAQQSGFLKYWSDWVLRH